MPPSLWDSLFGSKKPRNRSKRQRLRENQEKGRMGERRAEFWMKNMGYDVKRAPKGQDYIVSKPTLTGRTKPKRVEVKTGNSHLSPLQKKTQAAHRSNYHVVSGDSLLGSFDSLLSDATAKKPTRRRGRRTTSRKTSRHKSVFDL